MIKREINLADFQRKKVKGQNHRENLNQEENKRVKKRGIQPKVLLKKRRKERLQKERGLSQQERKRKNEFIILELCYKEDF